MIQAQRNYRAGERILLDPDGVLEVLEGVVALTVIHEDGAEVLLGLYGPGQVLAGHPEDACCIQLCAHADSRVWMMPWTEAARQPGFAGRLRDRLRTMEAWAAMQARPHLEQRLLGILSLLAEQFGRPASRGVLIEVRITQSQLASAVGATRTTVSRLLGGLRRRGLLIAVRSGRGERYCLQGWEGRGHAADLAPLEKDAGFRAPRPPAGPVPLGDS
jgi:CRP-like cAMP-binding protein